MTKPWEEHRATIVGLYKGKGWHLDTVKSYMEEIHGFIASTRAYRSQFKRWNVAKYTRHIHNSRPTQRRSGVAQASRDPGNRSYTEAASEGASPYDDGLDFAQPGLLVPVSGSKLLLDERLTPPSVSQFFHEDHSPGYGVMQHNTLDGNRTTPSNTPGTHLPTPMATSTSQSSYASTICDSSNSPYSTTNGTSTASSGNSFHRNSYSYTNRPIPAKDRLAGLQPLLTENDVSSLSLDKYKRQMDQTLYQTPRLGPEQMPRYYSNSKQDWSTDDYHKSKHLSPESVQTPAGGGVAVSVSSAFVSGFPYMSGDLVAQLPQPLNSSPATNTASALGGLDPDLVLGGSVLASIRRTGPETGVAKPQVTITGEEQLPVASRAHPQQHGQHFPHSGTQPTGHHHSQQFTLSPYHRQQQAQHPVQYQPPPSPSHRDQARTLQQQHEQQSRPPRLQRTWSLPGSTEASLMSSTLTPSAAEGTTGASVAGMLSSLTPQSPFQAFGTMSSVSAAEQTGTVGGSSTYHRLSVPFLFSSFDRSGQQRPST